MELVRRRYVYLMGDVSSKDIVEEVRLATFRKYEYPEMKPLAELAEVDRVLIEYLHKKAAEGGVAKMEAVRYETKMRLPPEHWETPIRDITTPNAQPQRDMLAYLQKKVDGLDPNSHEYPDAVKKLELAQNSARLTPDEWERKLTASPTFCLVADQMTGNNNGLTSQAEQEFAIKFFSNFPEFLDENGKLKDNVMLDLHNAHKQQGKPAGAEVDMPSKAWVVPQMRVPAQDEIQK